MLEVLFGAKTVDSIREVMGAANQLAVIGNVRIGRALAEREAKTWIVDADQRALKRVKRGEPVIAPAAKLPFGDGQLDAVVAVGLARDDGASLAEWQRVVKRGGVIVLVDRPPAAELTGRLLCAGLVDIEQRDVGREVVLRAATPRW